MLLGHMANWDKWTGHLFHLQKNPELCIDKKLAMPNMQLTLTNYGGYHDAIGYQARSNLYGGKAV